VLHAFAHGGEYGCNVMQTGFGCVVDRLIADLDMDQAGDDGDVNQVDVMAD
jgi:hypothetical protein